MLFGQLLMTFTPSQVLRDPRCGSPSRSTCTKPDDLSLESQEPHTRKRTSSIKLSFRVYMRSMAKTHTHTEAYTHARYTHTLLMLTQFSFHFCWAIISAHRSWSDNTGKAGYQSRCRASKPLGVVAYTEYTELLTLGCPQSGSVYVRN